MKYVKGFIVAIGYLIALPITGFAAAVCNFIPTIISGGLVSYELNPIEGAAE